MKFLVCGDYHCRNKPEGAFYTYRKLVRATTLKAEREGCSFIFHCGDLIHEKHCVLVDLLIMLYTEFEFAQTKGVRWVLMPGNHDIPAKHKPTQCILHLFKKVAVVYINRAQLKGPGWSIYLNPWRLPEAFKAQSKELYIWSKSDINPFKLQLAHIGLAEGLLSPSNTYRAPSAIRVVDLYPGAYTMTMCADYHTTQTLHDKLMYMGAPIAHMHGDAPNQGVWIVDTQTASFRQTDLPGTWPEFFTHNLTTKQDLEVLPHNNYKLRVSSELRPYYELKFGGKPNVKIEVVGDGLQRIPTARRLEGVNDGDNRSILKIWLQKKGYTDPAYYEAGDEYLSKAEGWLYEHRAG